jgi:hypothetical protein
VEQHQNSPAAEEGKKKKEVPGKRISAILGYELDDCSRGITYYSQERWKHVSDNFLNVRPEDEVEPTGCTAWIFEYSTDFLTSTRGMNWKNDKNEIMFHLRRNPDQFASDGNRLVLNSCNFPNGEESRDWATEEHISFSPADVGDSIHLRQIAVVVNETGFQVAWGGKVQYLFKHRLPWCSFKIFEVDPNWENSPDRTCIEKKSTTLQHILMSMCITRSPAAGILELEKDSNALFHKEVPGSHLYGS